MSESEFPRLFQEFYSIHEAINDLIKEGATPLEARAIERRLREKHPKLDIGPEMLWSAITAALAHTPEASQK